ECEYYGQQYSDGEQISSQVPTEDCSGCQQRVCQAGVVQWQITTNCSVKCCFFNGASYHPGRYIQNACARLVCEGSSGQFNYWGVDYNCPKCKAYLDPHIVTFDSWWSYSYQGCGNYSLTQIGNSYQPTVAVFATFVPCGGWSTLTCVDRVTFKNDEHTVITIEFKNSNYKIEVNGKDYDATLSSSSPSIVQVINNVYPVMAWKSWGCVNLQGSSGILVKFCGSSWSSNQVYVWSDYDVANELKGLCGTVNDNPDDDFLTRDGTVTSPWRRNPAPAFPLSWLSSDTSDGNCGGRNIRANRQTQNRCELDFTFEEKYYEQCNTTVSSGFSNAEPEEVLTIINDCVFDLCNVSDPDAWVKAVVETVEVQAVIQEDIQNFTTSAPDTTTPLDIITTTISFETDSSTPYTTIESTSPSGSSTVATPDSTSDNPNSSDETSLSPTTSTTMAPKPLSDKELFKAILVVLESIKQSYDA
ncbi:unnamed protein product, partial [Meganyctiphanes norvegica]